LARCGAIDISEAPKPKLALSSSPAVRESHLTYCDFDALERTPLQRDPFQFLVTPDFIKAENFASIIADYPVVPGPGSHPPAELDIRGKFQGLMEELTGQQFRQAIERKFDIDLAGRPTMYTVRGFVREKDGTIHTDSSSKIITVLLYMNERWQEDAGRLRLLRGPDNLDDYVAEVPPYGGTLLVFRRADNSWHGHKSISGPRRAIQLNWVTSQDVVDIEQRRHQLATKFKKFTRIFIPGSANAGH
jgi:SM-20-related protein